MQPFQRLIQAQQLIGYKYDGFWISMDTFKDKQQLDDLYNRGDAPWEVWKSAKNGRRGELARGVEGHQEKERPHQKCLTWVLASRPARPTGCSAWGRTATTSRSAAAGRS